MKQIIIALGREFGSGGHVIAKKLAEHYNIPLYNKELLDEIAKDGHFSKEMLEKFDERPISISFYANAYYRKHHFPLNSRLPLSSLDF